jgi:hypothetical protein
VRAKERADRVAPRARRDPSSAYDHGIAGPPQHLVRDGDTHHDDIGVAVVEETACSREPGPVGGETFVEIGSVASHTQHLSGAVDDLASQAEPYG